MTLADVASTVIVIGVWFTLAVGIAAVSERVVLWQRQRAIRKIQREQEREQIEWRQ